MTKSPNFVLCVLPCYPLEFAAPGDLFRSRDQRSDALGRMPYGPTLGLPHRIYFAPFVLFVVKFPNSTLFLVAAAPRYFLRGELLSR